MIKKFSLYVFPLLVVIFASIYLVNEPLYRQLISEDNLVEWFTFFFLFIKVIENRYNIPDSAECLIYLTA